MNRNEVSGKTDIAQTLLARNYKGFGNQDMNGVIEPERVLGIFDKENSTHQSGSVYNKDKIAPTLDTMQGGWGQPSIIDEPKMIEGIPIKNNTEQGYLIAREGDGVDLAYPTSNTRRGRVQESISQTLTTDDSKGVVEPSKKIRETEDGFHLARNDKRSSSIQGTHVTYPEGKSHCLSTAHRPMTIESNPYRIRKLTPLECFRLMGVTDEDFYKAQAVNSNTQLYKQAGNSIVVSVLEAIFRNMFLEVPEEDLVGEHIPLF